MSAPIEVTTKYVTTVGELSDAWAFVMERLDMLGPDPAISIRPIRIMSVGDMHDGLDGRETREPVREFEVEVQGMVREETP